MKNWKLRNNRDAITIGMIRRMIKLPSGWKKKKLLLEIIAEFMG